MKKVKETSLTTPSNLDLYQFAYSSIKQNYNFILHFYNMGILDEQRPLYFYPLK